MTRTIGPKRGAASNGQLCPSVQCSTEARLIGVLGPDGEMSYVRPSLPVSAKFVDTAERQGLPTTRFRFSGPCLRGGCRNWQDESCQIIETQLQMVSDAEPGDGAVHDIARDALPACAIRSSCVWFAQRQRSACSVCPRVITDTFSSAAP